MISVINDKDSALKAGWLALLERAPNIEGIQFDGFDIKAFKDGEITIGMLIIKGPELHVAIIPEYRKKWLSARLIKEVIGGIMDKYGYAVTTVNHDNLKGQNFVERLGFKRQSFFEGIIHYRMN